ncbi:hypothetical protein Acr_21g0005370 [Actinidia rufa]|uniref:Uncharacterized protein n=1 Tax=Actinidia rufa TaxID=165716 RepID=A0A7J0GGU4_9ERIC|nr:hypothetical protein Acr_21g0005370 [Actinidia rufa]
MDAFIIYMAAMDEPLNLNYIILKEMDKVRNHSNRTLLFGALLTTVLNHFKVKLSGQQNQYISKGFSITTIKRGISVDNTEDEDEEDEGASRRAMEVEETIDSPPSIQWRDEEIMHEEVPMQREPPMDEEAHMQGEFPMHGEHLSQEGTSTQGGPPVWFLELGNFYENQGQNIDRLGDLYENLYEQHTAFNQQCSNQMAEIEAQFEGLWVHIVPPPPPPPFNPVNAPHRPSYRAPPY